ncbi:porin [Halomonas eurihalina]|uniref:Porin n=1 Tax=Halomonas eurihalina TaxID=42566 RepID=A0A5D9CM36_HALER|nr:carbohydrate porin [Halomonas eurihalina]MDR5861193.1 carbohydrate porin [Halomonas eurihalina]TZG32569.1 porin [Halomonas eurihalina]
MQVQLKPCVGVLAALLANSAFADVVHEYESGKLTFGGDVELDVNAQNSQEGPIFLEGEFDSNDEYNQTGRILLEAAGEHTSGQNYAGFKVQPLVGTDGGMGVDDAWLALGNRDNGLELKVGRFEAFDLFPLGQDVFVEYSGDTANDLYSDGHGYIYQAKEGRGRGGDSGQVLLSQTRGDFYAEVSTLFGDRTNLFASDTYHGYAIDPENEAKNSFIVRPVMAWTPGPWTLAAGVETNVVDDAIVDERGEDISDRTGYGTRLSYSLNDFSVNANLAYLDAHEEENLTLGLNTLWHGFGLGYIHARNEIDSVKESAVADDVVSVPGTYTSDTLYASYRFAQVMGIDNFDIYLGTYYSKIDQEDGDSGDADRYGGRLRFKYYL